MNKKNIFSSLRLRQIINDLKRRPEDAAKDLDITIKNFTSYLNEKKTIDEKFVKKASIVWPVNPTDFINPFFKNNSNYKILRFKSSKKSSRIMKRGGKDYYEYRDTAMSETAPYRPEWIKQLLQVNNNSPHNKDLRWNKGHLLHQLTYFVGKVNFYYYSQNKKKVSIMNTGDSMFISPYVPHTFASRDPKSNAHIIAVTFSDKIDTSLQNEIVKMKKKSLANYIFSNKKKYLNKVTIKKYNSAKTSNIYYKKIKIIVEKKLASNKIVENSNFSEINILKENGYVLCDNFHRYLYVLSDKAGIKIDGKNFKLKKGDSLYVGPFTKIVYKQKKSKFLVVNLESKFTNQVISQLSKIGKENFNRIISENKQWF